jgi:hypothetical protein
LEKSLAKDVLKENAEENVWTYEKHSNMRLENSA